MKIEDLKFNLKPGDDVKIIKGKQFWGKPDYVKFVKEYPAHLLFESKFTSPVDKSVSLLKFSLSKASFICGDAKVKKVVGKNLVDVMEVVKDEH